MDLFALRVLPAGQRANLADGGLIDDVDQRRTAADAKEGAFSVSWFDLTTVHLDLAISSDGRLRQVERVVVVFQLAQDNCDVVCRRTLADGCHLGGVPAE